MTVESSSFRNTIGWLGRDLQLGVRMIKRRPAASLLIAAMLGLGIGQSAVVYMFADAILLQPLEYPAAEDLAVIQVQSRGAMWHGTSEPGLHDLRELDSFESLTGWRGRPVTLLGEPESRRLLAVEATADLAQTLGVQPELGRFFDAAEDSPGGADVVVVSHAFWRSSLGGMPDAVGATVSFDGEPFRVVGVMPEGFHYPTPRFDLYFPLKLDLDAPWARNNHYLNVVARLAPGVTFDEAVAVTDVLAAQTESAYPEIYANGGHRLRVQSMREAFLGTAETPVLIVVAAVLALLLLTCANVANLQLWRAAERERELDVRRTLGALRGRLVSQLVVETLILAGLGGLLAVAIAKAGERLLPALLPESLPRADQVSFEPRVVAVVLGLTVLVTVLCGLWPALRSTIRSGAMTRRDHGATRKAVWVRRGLVVVQVGLAVLLLLGCGLMARTLQELARVDAGFNADGVVVFDVSLPPGRYDTDEKAVAFFENAERALGELPGVLAAGSVGSLPLDGGVSRWSIEIEGQPVATVSDAPASAVQQVTPSAFEALGLRLEAGRAFEKTDTVASVPVVVINETMAKLHWPGQEALGKRFRVFSEDAPWMTVVGVVGDVRYFGLDQPAEDRWYVPHAQAFETAYYSPRDMTFAVRLAPGPSAATEATMGRVLETLRSLDPTVPIVDLAEYEEIVQRSIALPRQLTAWLAIFSAVAISLAVLGLFGVLSRSVASRRREIGVRMALGAEPLGIVLSVLREGMVMVGTGWLVGLLAALALSSVASATLFSVRPTDPLAIAGVTLLLLATALVACAVPARRAGTVDPQVCLREDG